MDSEQTLEMDVSSRRAVSVGAQLQRREAIIAGVSELSYLYGELSGVILKATLQNGAIKELLPLV